MHEFNLLYDRVNSFIMSQAFLISGFALSMSNTNPQWGRAYRLIFPIALAMLRLTTDRGQALREAIMACRKGGVLSILGVYGVMDKFPIGAIMNKGLTVRTAQQHGQKYLPRLLEHAALGELNPSFLATHKFTLEDAPHGYELFRKRQDECVRAVFTPGN